MEFEFIDSLHIVFVLTFFRIWRFIAGLSQFRALKEGLILIIYAGTKEEAFDSLSFRFY